MSVSVAHNFCDCVTQEQRYGIQWKNHIYLGFDTNWCCLYFNVYHSTDDAANTFLKVHNSYIFESIRCTCTKPDIHILYIKLSIVYIVYKYSNYI